MTTRVLLTGVSGVGKSTITQELAARGYRAVDADLPGLSHDVEVDDDELTGMGPGKDWVWREDRIREVLDVVDVDLLFVSGCSPNQGKFYDRFDDVVLLTAPPDVIRHRLATRSSNAFGKESGEMARALELLRTIEPRLRSGASLELDTTAPIDEVVTAILDHVAPRGG